MKRNPKKVSRQEEIFGILLMTLGVLIFVSLLSYNPAEVPENTKIGNVENQLGIAGVYISHFLNHNVIGRASFVFPVIILLLGWCIFSGSGTATSFRWSAYLLIFALYTSVILAIPQTLPGGADALGNSLSGLIGIVIAKILLDYLGILGSIVVLLAIMVMTAIGVTNISISGFLSNLGWRTTAMFTAVRRKVAKFRKERKVRVRERKEALDVKVNWQSEDRELNIAEDKSSILAVGPQPKSQLEITFAEDGIDDGDSSNADFSQPETVRERPPIGNYTFPPLDLFENPAPALDALTKDELFANAQILEDRLLEFGVQSKVIDIKPGPVITRYEVEPAPGVKISRIVGLSDDLALAMRARSIRIVAPIPGKAAVGIEIPNRTPAKVSFKEVLISEAFQKSDSPLTMALGKTISGEPYVACLADMPHLLIAGATGSGKSVCINAIIASFLYKAHPTELQLVMIDPKKLELSVYNNLRSHHLTYREDLNEEVVTTPANAISVLKSMESVMDQRYEVLAQAGVRNIADYNNRLKNGELPKLDDQEPWEPLEYLVLIIDELADLMLTAAREVEEPIARLTQMSRAVGIHLIVATQRPSVDVITGVIKANFPARLAFQVASKTDSRTILDLNGAEKLLGMGDMLFLPPGSPEAIRLHGPFVSTEEIEKIIGHIRRQPKYPKRLLPAEKGEAVMGPDDVAMGFSQDNLYNEAAKLVVRHQQGSISLLQRRLKVGYARAARLIDELETGGVVGPFDGSKARDVLIPDEEQLDELGIS